jgi:hypothetical protein
MWSGNWAIFWSSTIQSHGCEDEDDEGCDEDCDEGCDEHGCEDEGEAESERSSTTSDGPPSSPSAVGIGVRE